jgi:CheY-like chemotaxis protein
MATETTCSPSVANLRILVVDNDRDNADSLGLLVGVWGHKARTVYGGAEALALVPEFRPDAMLVDLGMPLMNGLELARRVRQLVWGKDVLLVAVTGHGLEQNYREARDAGFDHLLVKPVESSVLRDLLARELANRCPTANVA